MEFDKCNSASAPLNYVAIAGHFHDRRNTLTHAGIVIRHRGEYFLHHFLGFERPSVDFGQPEDGWGVYKIIDTIPDNELHVGSILAQCQRICDKSKVVYSYIGASGCYDKQGHYVTKSGLPEIATCVGFCLSTLNTILLDSVTDYLRLEDWPHYSGQTKLSEEVEAALAEQYPSLDWGEFLKYRKRVTVLEFFASAFLHDRPIAKSAIDAIVPDVLEKVRSAFSS